MSEDRLTDLGFIMGAATVTRLATVDGTAVVRIAGAGKNWVDVYVSPAGRSVRVFRNQRGEMRSGDGKK